MKVNKYLFTLVIFALSQSASAQNQYNKNSPHVITEILTYPYDKTILFRVKDMPNIPGCSPQYFEISANASYESRTQTLSRLLTAYTAKELVNIGYDGENCAPSSYILVYRVG